MKRTNVLHRFVRTVLYAVVVIFLAPMVRAQDAAIPWSVVGSGGVIGATDGSNLFSATAGQAIIWAGRSSDVEILQGFWVPLPTPSSVNYDGLVAGSGHHNLRSFPNPFSITTTIAYHLDERSRVSLEIVDLLGNRVATLVDAVEDAGDHGATWDGMISSGSRAGGGVYVSVLNVQPGASTTSATHVERQKIVLVR